MKLSFPQYRSLLDPATLTPSRRGRSVGPSRMRASARIRVAQPVLEVERHLGGVDVKRQQQLRHPLDDVNAAAVEQRDGVRVAAGALVADP